MALRLILALGLLAGDVRQDADELGPAWRALAAWRAGDAARAEEVSEIAERLDPVDPRRVVLEAWMASLRGEAVDLSRLRLARTWPLGGEGSWWCAAILPPGTERNRALREALDRTPLAAGSVRQRERVQLAFDGWIEAAEDFRFDEALAIGGRLHAEARAAWSAISYSLTLNRAGHALEADAVLAEALRSLAPGRGLAAELFTQRGIYALGAGRDHDGLWHLWRALARGSTDAVAILARRRLAQGQWADAREGFRAVVGAEPEHPWGQRGWGLSLLPLAPGPGGGGRRSY